MINYMMKISIYYCNFHVCYTVGFYWMKYRVVGNTMPIYIIMGVILIINRTMSLTDILCHSSLFANLKSYWNPFELVLILVPGIEKHHKCFLITLPMCRFLISHHPAIVHTQKNTDRGLHSAIFCCIYKPLHLSLHFRPRFNIQSYETFHSEILQCCRGACQISERSDNS